MKKAYKLTFLLIVDNNFLSIGSPSVACPLDFRNYDTVHVVPCNYEYPCQSVSRMFIRWSFGRSKILGKERGDLEIKDCVVMQKPQPQTNRLPPPHTLQAPRLYNLPSKT